MKSIVDFRKRVFEFSRSELAHWGGLENVLEELGGEYELLGIDVSEQRVRLFVERR